MRRSGWRRQATSVCLILASPTMLAGCGSSGDRNPGADTPKVIGLTGQPQHVVLPAHKEYGIYVDDANNSGYTLRCSATDAQGRRVHMDDHTPATISTSGTNNLDLVYDTGPGDLTFRCSASGAGVTTRLLTGLLQ